ncbi:Fic family protein [Inquilinus sp. YAF38]|uniref:Fic family protein n=1 Tax=Inquilinus sp. YAF38 TaxID=3233084 RepID=UPI003F901089
MTDGGGARHSIPLSADLVTDPDEKARRESLNALKQAALVQEMVETYTQTERPFKLRPSTLLTLQRVALEGLSAYAGNWRPAGIAIAGSKHTPVDAFLVPEEIERLCDYVNDNWEAKSPIHLASYMMWRLNWIHPFVDGNGRTSRAASYLVMCIRLGYFVPGLNTIPDQIISNREPYYEALDAADEADRNGGLDLGRMEALLTGLLAAQLMDVFQRAKGDEKKATSAQ